MKTENILIIEDSGETRINLVRDRLFWQAWNKSAFLFSSHIKKYQVHKRFIQKVSQDVAWLGFPSNALSGILKMADDKGFKVERKSSDHIIISNIPQASGYEEWWATIVKTKPKPCEPNFQFAKNANNSILAAYKTSYDLCLHINRATVKMPREYRYELGARIRAYATDITEDLHLAANNIKRCPDVSECAEKAHRLRIDIRILKDLQQMGIEQWGFLNNQIETLLNLLRAEFCNTGKRIAKATLNQSSGTLTTGNGEH